MRLDATALSGWSFLAAIALWTPAIGVKIGAFYLQPMDFLVIVGLPFLAIYWPIVPASTFLVTAVGISSFVISFQYGGTVLVLGYYLAFIVPFLFLMAIVARHGAAARAFVAGFLAGCGASVTLNISQLIFGAAALDFRSNQAFELPAQYGRAFSLFPEVSTYAVHAILAIAVVFVLAGQTARLRSRDLVLMLLAAAVLATLLFSRSATLFVLLPVLLIVAVLRQGQLRTSTVHLVVIIAALGVVGTTLINKSLFAGRLETASVERSISMRAASVIAGASPLITGEVAGVGLGNNHKITRRAYDVARSLDLRFGSLPDGVNSLIVARIFEEGWPAVAQIVLALGLMTRALTLPRAGPLREALLIIALGSLLSALLVTGYRGIYTSWLWLGMVGGLSLAPPRPLR